MIVAILALGACTPGEPPGTVDGPIALLDSVPPVDTLAFNVVEHHIHAIVQDNQVGDEVSPYVYAAFDETARRYAGVVAMKEACTASATAFPFVGQVDIGATLEVGIGEDVLVARRAPDYFEKGQLVYLFNPNRSDVLKGMDAGSPFKIQGQPAPIAIPARLKVQNPVGVLNALVADQVLDMTWEPDPSQPESTVVYALVAMYNGPVSTATRHEAVWCRFTDDGHAKVDLSTMMPDGWPHLFLHLGRVSRGFVDHPQLGMTLVRSERMFKLEDYMGQGMK